MPDSQVAISSNAFLTVHAVFDPFNYAAGSALIVDAALHRMEMGEQNVTRKTLEQICDRVKCKISVLFGEA